MANKSEQNLFQQLTTLFKSGSVVKRKIRSFDTSMAVPDKVKSSGVLLFQKSISPTYATISANAYNLSERLMRMQDFQEMVQTPEIAAALSIYADETVAVDEKGRALHVYSNNPKIKEILEELFYDTLNVEFNLRSNVYNLPIHKDTPIPLLDGRNITIEQLAIEFNEGKENWVYSIQDKTNRIVPGKVVWCGLTKKNSKLVRVHLDDGTHVDTSPEHEYVLRDGSRKRADQLCENDSLMPFYRRITDKSQDGDFLNGYEKVYNPEVNEYRYTHRLVAEDLFRKVPELTNTMYYKRAAKASNARKGTIPSGFVKNHKVLFIEFLKEQSDVYCMEVLGQNGEHDRHTFMVLGLDENNQPTVNSGICLQNCKFGDFFTYNDVHPNYGIVGSFPIPVNEVEREENYDREDPFAVRFRWTTLGNRTLENWEVSHFRLLGSDQFIPYGCSVLEGARRVWRQLLLLEDAMLVYRVSRAPERRVFYVDVGNLKADEVETYMEQQRTRMRTASVVDQSTGRVDLRYSPLPVHKDTPIPLLDGRTITIEELSKELSMSSGVTKWVYSVQDKTNKVVPGKVVWCGKNYAASTLVKVWLDNGSYVMTAPEHPFVMRDGSSKRADKLVEGDSLMPLYKKMSAASDGDYINGYEKIYDPETETYKYTHRVVAESVEKPALCGRKVVHHVDFNKLNNTPENLCWMEYYEHRRYHAKCLEKTANTPERLVEKSFRWASMNKTDAHKSVVSETNKRFRKAEKMGEAYNGTQLHASHNENRRQGQLKSWSIDREKRCQAFKWIIPDSFVEAMRCELIAEPTLSRDRLHQRVMSNKKLVESLQSIQIVKKDISKLSYVPVVDKLIELGYAGFGDFKKQTLNNVGYKNHKVSRVETITLETPEDVYCMTVVGPNGEEDRHNFAACGLLPNDDGSVSQVVGIILKNSIDEDYWIPTRGGESGTKIDTLAGLQNQGNVEDVAYLQKKLFAALQIPRAYLGYEDGLGSKASLAQLDVRFSRTIANIQRVIISELNKTAVIHLFAHGFRGDDLQNFVLRLSNPSTVAQQQKLELWRTKLEIAGSAPEGLLDRNFLRREILLLNDEQIEELDEGRYQDKLVDLAIENAGSDENVVAGDQEQDAGDELDLEAGNEGEAEAPSGEEEKPAEAEKPAENASELPPGEEDDLDLLISSDIDEDDDFASKAMLEVDGLPIKPQGQLQRALYNQQRRRTHGSSKTHIPDTNKMLSKNDAADDPFDSNFFREVARFNESVSAKPVVRLSTDLKRTLKNMALSEKFVKAGTIASFDQRSGLISEGTDVQGEIDALSKAGDLDIEIDIVNDFQPEEDALHDDMWEEEE